MSKSMALVVVGYIPWYTDCLELLEKFGESPLRFFPHLVILRVVDYLIPTRLTLSLSRRVGPCIFFTTCQAAYSYFQYLDTCKVIAKIQWEAQEDAEDSS